MPFLVPLVLAALLLMPAGPPQSRDSRRDGFLEVHLHIVSLPPVEPEGGDRPAFTESYAEYPLIVLDQNGKEITHVTSDVDGNVRIALPPGGYVVDVKDRVRKHLRGKPQPFTIRPGQTTHITLEMDAGVRSAMSDTRPMA
jgi:hypothetical protein